MQSTSDASHQSNHNNSIKNGSTEEPSHLTRAAIKSLQDSQEKKHHTNLNYILQIVRIRDLMADGKASAKSSTSASGANGAAGATTASDKPKPTKANIKYK